MCEKVNINAKTAIFHILFFFSRPRIVCSSTAQLIFIKENTYSERNTHAKRMLS